MPTPLTLTHLRFDCTARSPIKLGGRQAGERLRNALAAVMLTAVCPETERSRKPTPAHAAACPACWLLAAGADSGDVRRAYSLVPPLAAADVVEPGQSFSFTLTLLGIGFQYLPYFVLAVPAMGSVGVGPGRGQFDVQAIWALNPFTQTAQPVLKPGEQVVRLPDCLVTLENTQAAAQDGIKSLKNNLLALEFVTPTRLVYRLGEQEALLKIPAFDIFFRRLLERMDELSRQLASADSRPRDEIDRLYALASQVRLVEAQTAWIDLFSWSGRKEAQTPMGGFAGKAHYHAQDWSELMPYILFGQSIQVGRLTVKGNGVFQARLPGMMPYWEWIYPKEVDHDHRTTSGSG